jgi:streptomycin 6-kinase
MATIPPQLAENIRMWHGAEGERWLAELPARIQDMATRWRLHVGEPFAEGGAVSWVAPARQADGTDAVLKVFLADRENQDEPAALAHYAGHGAVRMFAEEQGALLLERLLPGTPLWDVDDDDAACRVVMDILRKLWQPPSANAPFRSLSDEAALWSRTLTRLWNAQGRPFERSLVDEAVAAANDLAETPGELVVLHQDLHGGNVLRAEREQWLAIDPKPLVGEREFDLASLIRDRREDISEVIVRRRLDLLSAELGLDRERMRRWALLHALAWGVEDQGVDEVMVACARWLAAA